MWGLPKGRKQLAANIDAASAEVDTNAGGRKRRNQTYWQRYLRKYL